MSGTSRVEPSSCTMRSSGVISVPMVDIQVRADGLRAEDAVKLITEPLETIVKSIDDVEHVYSQTDDDGALAGAKRTSDFLTSAGITHVYKTTPGAHTWIVWRKYLNEVAPLLWRSAGS